MTTFYVIVLLIIIIAIFGSVSNSKELAKLKEQYEKSLRSRNKKAALDAGRSYYSKMRNGKLTIYDEQAITNDLTAMK